jgi:hypothetical protein
MSVSVLPLSVIISFDLAIIYMCMKVKYFQHMLFVMLKNNYQGETFLICIDTKYHNLAVSQSLPEDFGVETSLQ